MAFLTRLSNNRFKNFSTAKPLFWFLKLWATVINSGVGKEMPLWERKRTRLLNGICTMGFISQFWFVCMYTHETQRVVFWEALQSAVFYIIIIVLNKYSKYNLACHLFCIYNILCYSFFAIAHGSVDGAEYFLLPSGMASMLFFKNTRIIITYLFLNFAAFWICKYSFTALRPMIQLPFNTYVPNQIFLFIVSFLIVYYFRSESNEMEKVLHKQNDAIAAEKIKSDNLLLNILPLETAEELKVSGSVKAKYFEAVTVMFTDFHNFTQISEHMRPEELLKEINYYFSYFDTIISKYDIEKIKTIGDSYMCAAGLPNRNPKHALDVVCAAREIMDFVLQCKAEKIALNQPYLELRIGIHSGPIVAGIVGTKKFAYDIWGDTVNVASRMESSGEEGKINISGACYELVKHKIKCTYRGKINAKNKGMVDMYFVDECY